MAKILKIDQEIITVLLDNDIIKDFPSSNFRFRIWKSMEIDAIQSLNNENQYMFAPKHKKKKTDHSGLKATFVIVVLLIIGAEIVLGADKTVGPTVAVLAGFFKLLSK